ncbi:hypothetical protein [Dongia rigui]|uniref:Uncharacterized protein n=1 Tax=Dongia rigui TaxID=940149 RepID=A0ABU5DY04_9PROT|nr:hypothetical protein [Dongia rigui]MDY0871819.1 hypothetical protein [Dongia rigui]
MAKSWNDKRTDPAPHQVKVMDVTRAGVEKGGRMLLPSVRLIDDFIRAVPTGRSIGNAEMRAALAKRHKADGCCPVYTGYHLRTCAEAAIEDHERGVPVAKLTPVWRVLDDNAPTLKKLSARGRAFIEAQRKKEGL